jgi:hypothetical protein
MIHLAEHKAHFLNIGMEVKEERITLTISSPNLKATEIRCDAFVDTPLMVMKIKRVTKNESDNNNALRIVNAFNYRFAGQGIILHLNSKNQLEFICQLPSNISELTEDFFIQKNRQFSRMKKEIGTGKYSLEYRFFRSSSSSLGV